MDSSLLLGMLPKYALIVIYAWNPTGITAEIDMWSVLGHLIEIICVWILGNGEIEELEEAKEAETGDEGYKTLKCKTL